MTQINITRGGILATSGFSLWFDTNLRANIIHLDNSLSVGNQIEWLLRVWRISRRWTKRRCSLLSDVVWFVGVKSVRTAAWVICMGGSHS
jgi:hypothetical protein